MYWISWMLPTCKVDEDFGGFGLLTKPERDAAG